MGGKKRLLIKVGLSLFLIFTPFVAQGDEMVFIVNKESPLPPMVSVEKIKDIYLGKVNAENNIKLLPVNHKDKLVFEEFVIHFLEMTVSAYKSYWVRKAFAEGATPPIMLADSQEIIKYISETKGGIGYIWETNVIDLNENIRQIEIGGKQPELLTH